MITDDYHLVTTKTISCDGNGNANGLGHPRVFLKLSKDNRIRCPYCNRLFVYQKKGPKLASFQQSLIEQEME